MKQRSYEGEQQGRRRYFPEDRRDDMGRRYQSGGYQEETGNFADEDEFRNPARRSQEQDRDRDRERDRDKSGESWRQGGEYRHPAEAGGQAARGLGWNDPSRWGPSYDADQRLAGENRSDAFGGAYGGIRTAPQLDRGQFWRTGPSYRGKGPKGYQRSDDRLKELICEKLTDDDRVDASDISVEVKACEVKLTGTVADRQTKHLVEDLVEQCGGVREIENQLRINRTGSGARDTTTTGGSERTGKKPGQAGRTTGIGSSGR